MYDVIVAGGGTAGCAAAYIAGKYGLKTLLLEKESVLGGAMTSGLVIPMMESGKNNINSEFYNDLIREMQNYNGQITYKNNAGWFNPEILKIVLDAMMAKVNVDTLFNTTIHKILHKNSIIQTVYINKEILSVYSETIEYDNKILFEPIDTKYLIDATGNCEIGKILNCNFLDKNKNLFQPVSLRFIMGGINLDKFSKWLLDIDKDRSVTTCEYIDGNIHLSTAYTWDANKHWALAPLFEDAVKNNILKDTDRNYFQIFTVANMPNCMAFNCPRIVENINPNMAKDITMALQLARAAIFRLSEFCKKYFPGFENAYISTISDKLGIRVSDRIEGKYIYTSEDIKSGKKFDNIVLTADYPIDVHSTNKDSSILSEYQEYHLPIESLMVKNYDNLFVVGKCLSADFLAQGALRVQASCFSMGEAVSKYIKNKLL